MNAPTKFSNALVRTTSTRTLHPNAVILTSSGTPTSTLTVSTQLGSRVLTRKIPRKKKTTVVRRACEPPAAVRTRLHATAGTIITPPITANDIREYYDAVKQQKKTPLFHAAAKIPSDVSLSDLQWLHELEKQSYTPPWKHPAPCSADLPTVLEPTIDLSIPDAIPDSCPDSPLILHEIADSDDEVHGWS